MRWFICSSARPRRLPEPSQYPRSATRRLPNDRRFFLPFACFPGQNWSRPAKPKKKQRSTVHGRAHRVAGARPVRPVESDHAHPAGGHGGVPYDRAAQFAGTPAAVRLPDAVCGTRARGANRKGRDHAVPGPDDGPVGHHRHGQHRRRGHGHRSRRPGSRVLDVGDRPGGHGDEVQRSGPGGALSGSGRPRCLCGRAHVLHPQRPGEALGLAGRCLRTVRGDRRVRHWQHRAIQLRGASRGGVHGPSLLADRRGDGRGYLCRDYRRHPAHCTGGRAPGTFHGRGVRRRRPGHSPSQYRRHPRGDRTNLPGRIHGHGRDGRFRRRRGDARNSIRRRARPVLQRGGPGQRTHRPRRRAHDGPRAPGPGRHAGHIHRYHYRVQHDRSGDCHHGRLDR